MLDDALQSHYRQLAQAAVDKPAFDDFLRRGFPHRKDDDWRYLAWGSLAQHAFTLPAAPHLSMEAIEGIKARLPRLQADEDSAQYLFCVDGHWLPHASIGDFTEDLQVEPLHGVKDNAFLQLNRAFTQPVSVQPASTMYLVYVTTETPLILQQSALHLVYPQGEPMTLIEAHVNLASGQQVQCSNHRMHLHVPAHTQLRHFYLQQLSTEHTHVMHRHVEQETGSQYDFNALSLGAGLARNDTSVYIRGRDADCKLSGLTLAQGEQGSDHHMGVSHTVPHATSEQHFLTLLNDRAKGVFNGKVHVPAGAHRTAAHQLSRHWLLSQQAQAYGKPELEIYDGDIECSHGATTGSVDREALRYLRSRGIPQQQAYQLMMQAFVQSFMDRVDPALQPWVEKTVYAALEQVVC